MDKKTKPTRAELEKQRKRDSRYATLFAGFVAKNAIEKEMANRYLNWFEYYEQEHEVVQREGTTTEGGNGVPYPSPHYSNMLRAEGEMRRLWKQLEKSITPTKQVSSELGEFENL